MFNSYTQKSPKKVKTVTEAVPCKVTNMHTLCIFKVLLDIFKGTYMYILGVNTVKICTF